jgi:hypothetical protein
MRNCFLSSVCRLLKKAVVFLVLALLLFPAAEFILAAGDDLPQNVISEGLVMGSRFDQLAPNEDFFVYLPLVLRRWPPLPYAPLLSPIAGPALDAPYVLSWSADLSKEVELFLFYEIEESTTPDFVNSTVYTTPFVYTSTLVFSSYEVIKPVGTVATYYYRVRAYNSWGAGAWSNVESVLVSTRVDDFTNPLTGWRARRTSAPDMSSAQAVYLDGALETYVTDKFDFAIFAPMYPAPPTPYSIHLKTRLLRNANELSHGIVFGGNQGTYCDVVRENAMGTEGCFSHYYRINAVLAGSYWKFDVSRVDSHDDRGRGISTSLSEWINLSGMISDPADWLDWLVKVYDDGFAIYLNGRYMLWISDTEYLQDSYYGIFGSTFEYNNSRFRHDYFNVAPISEASHPALTGETPLLSGDRVFEPR